MFTLTSELLLTLFASSWIFVLCQETPELKVKAGEDVTLQCHGGADISLIGWSRTDLKPDDSFVFLFRDGGSNENNQHPSFRGRVNLRDPEMRENGDASVILRNVTINDTGTYECQIREGNKEGKSDPSSVIKLTVTGHTAGHKEGGDKGRNIGLMVGLPVIALLLVAVVGVFRFMA